MGEEQKIVVAMSGGLDSSVTALLLSDEGYELVGAHLKLWPHGGNDNVRERQERQIHDAQSVADRFGMPLHVLDFQEDFEREVVATFVREYRCGRTPNPCIICNPRIKMGVLLDWALSQGAQAVATGHYAQVGFNEETGRWELRRGVATNKDQSYFLCCLTQEKLARFRTPMGTYTKDEARAIARDRGLDVWEKNESQEICFIPDDDYRRFLSERFAEAARELEGPIVDRAGEILGWHKGIHHFTIGQRRGIGVSAPTPLYVLEIDPEERAVIVGPADGLIALALETGPATWGAIAGLEEPRRAFVKIRYRTPPSPALLTQGDDGNVRVDFDVPQRAVTPGQTAAFYDETGEIVLGGARIDRAL